MKSLLFLLAWFSLGALAWSTSFLTPGSSEPFSIHKQESKSIDLPVTFRDTDFIDDRRGWAITNHKLYKTEDGGTTWLETTIVTSETFEAVQLLSPNEGWVLEGDHLLHSIDGGVSWRKIKLNSVIARSFRFLNRKQGWCVGQWLRLPKVIGDHERWYPVIYETRNGGQNWFRVHRGDEDPYPLWAVWPISAKEIWAVGSLVLHSIDGGRTWMEVDPDAHLKDGEGAFGTPCAVRFANQNTGWIKTNQGDRYYVTNDGGRTWQVRLDKNQGRC